MSPSHGARCSSSSGGGSIGQWGGVEFIVEKVQSDTVEIVVTDFGCDIGFYIGWDDGLSDVFAAEAPSAIAADEAVVVGELVGVPAKRSYSQVGFVWGGGSGGGGSGSALTSRSSRYYSHSLRYVPGKFYRRLYCHIDNYVRLVPPLGLLVHLFLLSGNPGPLHDIVVAAFSHGPCKHVFAWPLLTRFHPHVLF